MVACGEVRTKAGGAVVACAVITHGGAWKAGSSEHDIHANTSGVHHYSVASDQSKEYHGIDQRREHHGIQPRQ